MNQAKHLLDFWASFLCHKELDPILTQYEELDPGKRSVLTIKTTRLRIQFSQGALSAGDFTVFTICLKI